MIIVQESVIPFWELNTLSFTALQLVWDFSSLQTFESEQELLCSPPGNFPHFSFAALQLVGDFLAAFVDTRYTRKEITKIDILKNSQTMKSFQVKECVTGMRQKTGGVRRRQDI